MSAEPNRMAKIGAISMDEPKPAKPRIRPATRVTPIAVRRPISANKCEMYEIMERLLCKKRTNDDAIRPRNGGSGEKSKRLQSLHGVATIPDCEGAVNACPERSEGSFAMQVPRK